jgi:RND family efflux transporter MFP subunit
MKGKITNIAKHLNPVRLFKKWWKIKGIKKWLLAILVMVILFIAGRQARSVINRGKPDLGKNQIVKVVKKDMQKLITKEGILRFAGVIDYPAPTSGIISNVWVKDGDEVKKGQKILQLQSTASPEDQADTWSQYAAAKSAYETAQIAKMTSQVSLETARQAVLVASQARQDMENRFAVNNHTNPSANRPDTNYTENEIEAIKSTEAQARSKFTIAERDYNTTEVRIQAAQAALSSSLWKYQLTKDSTITAPISGKITNLNIQKGETISSQNGILFRIINSSDLIITLKASEAEVLQFETGQKAEFKTAVYPDLKFKAEVFAVDAIGTEVTSDTGSVTEYLVKIKPEATNNKFLSPMTVDTDTIVQQKSSVLAVPNAAVNYSEGKRTVTLVKNGRIETREVVLGIISDDSTEIVSGLSEGDEVLVPKASKL